MKTKNIVLLFLSVALTASVVSCRKDPAGTDDPQDTAVDLSAAATANCYIVPAAGEYKFNAGVKGCSKESVVAPVSAEVLWETFSCNKAVERGDLLTAEAKVRKGYVYFKTPDEMKEGNAVIAVKNSAGEIVWSWHIWFAKDFVPTRENQQVYNNDAGVMMCCNLGAVSDGLDRPYNPGLLYQWGRKDPFPGAMMVGNKCSMTPTTLVWPDALDVKDVPQSDNCTLAYVTANPTTYICCDYLASLHEWYCTDKNFLDKGLWAASKTKYDPCPPGWRVPDIDNSSNCVWGTAFGKSSGEVCNSLNQNWYESYWRFTKDNLARLSDSAEVIYPAGGCLSPFSGSMYYSEVNKSEDCWTSTYTLDARCFHLAKNVVSWNYSSPSCSGNSVRCIAE